MSEFSEISSEAAALVRQWAGRRGCSDSVKALIRRAARRLGFSYSRTKSLWYREAKSVLANEMDALRKREKAADGHDEIASLRRRIARLERHFAFTDAADTLARISGAGNQVHRSS